MRSRIQLISAGAGSPSGTILEVCHDGLRRHRRVHGANEAIVRRKAALQAEEWDARWRVVDGRRRDLSARLAAARHAEDRRALALERTALAQQELHQLATLLKFTLAVYDPVDWEMLKAHDPFSGKRPELEPPPPEPPLENLPEEPRPAEIAYRASLGLLDRLIPGRVSRRLAEAAARFAADHARWQARAAAVRARNGELLQRHFALQAHRAEVHAFQLAAWKLRQREFLAAKATVNAAVDEMRHAYFALVPAAVAEYCDLVLAESQLPDSLPKEFEVDYDPRGKLLVVDYRLPSPADLPTLESVEYDAGREEFVEHHLPPPNAAALYGRVLCQLALRTVHELFEADAAGALDSVVLNGRVIRPAPAIGEAPAVCILSLRAARATFGVLHLAQVDPGTCFRDLGGIASAPLHALEAVTPLVARRG